MGKKLPFCCPVHGTLHGKVLYASILFSTKKIVDLPYKYCDSCDINYTPFGDFVYLFPNISIQGRKLAVGKMSKEGRVFVERPKIVPMERDISECPTKDINDKKKTLTTRNAFIRELFLANKRRFVEERLCPKCFRKLKKEYVGIKMFDKGGYVCSNIYSCEICKQDYVSPEMLEKIYNKAQNKFNRSSFYLPDNIHIFWGNSNYWFYTPYYYKDTENYDIRNLPPQQTMYYDLDDDEYNCFIDFYVKYNFKNLQNNNYEYPEFDGILNDKSVLKKHGYSIKLLNHERRMILKKCISLYGIDKVLQILNFNINMRRSQENGESKFATALSVWRKDIEFIEEIYDV